MFSCCVGDALVNLEARPAIHELFLDDVGRDGEELEGDLGVTSSARGDEDSRSALARLSRLGRGKRCGTGIGEAGDVPFLTFPFDCV